jgi:sugar lactone lactonase YvrE
MIAQEQVIAQKNPSSIAFTVDEKDLFPEGITYDSITEQFFLSSISKEKIIAIDHAGNQTDFVKPQQDGMYGSLGLKVDVQRRRLWAISYGEWGDEIISAVHIYDIDSKKLVKKFFTEKNKIPAFNDLILTNSGGAFITDWIGNGIYQIPPDLSRVELFLKSDNLLHTPNGINISPDNSFLYVASHTNGILLVDVATREIRPITNRLAVDTKGIDGLMIYKNSLIGILNPSNNASQYCIARYLLSDNGREILGASIIDQNNPLFVIPTTGVIVNDELYCLAATYLNLYTTTGSIDTNQLKNPTVLKYKLER